MPNTSALTVDPTAPTLTNVYRLARTARAVYSRERSASWPLLESAYPQLIPFERERIYGAVAANETDLVLAFRGSDENREWLHAMACNQIPGPVGRVHEGLAAALDTVWQPIMAAFYDTAALDKRIWICGHSLGGALATLAAFRLTHEGFQPHFAATFGAPRVLDPAAARAFTTPLYRVVNSDDLIPDFPWPTLLDTYTHVGELIYLLPSGAIAHPRHNRHLAHKLDRADGIGAPLPRTSIIDDHFATSYIEKLARHA